MQDLFISLSPQLNELSPQEKGGCAATAIRMVNLSKFALINGIISLKDEVTKDHPFLVDAVDIFLDSHYGEDLEKILKYLIISNKYTGTELLECLLMAQGMVSISEMKNLVTIAYIMKSMLGGNYLDKFINNLRSEGVNVPFLAINEYISYCEESKPFEEALYKLNFVKLEILLLRTDNDTLVGSLKGCGKLFIDYIKTKIPDRRFGELIHLMKYSHHDTTDILNSQKTILNALSKLEYDGFPEKFH